MFDGDEPLRFNHIIKTGGESLEAYLAKQTVPRLDFGTCRSAALTTTTWSNSTNASANCLSAGAVVSSALCGLNCECCAADVRLPEGGFHGTLLRSPRAHVLSQFSHCHIAHHGTWGRALADVPLFFAESLLQGTEYSCGSYSSGPDPDWKGALETKLASAKTATEDVRVISMHNTQAHALTCSKSRGSLGHHFRVHPVDPLEPPLDDALASLHRFEWFGLTDLFEHSLCLLHYQANQTLPASCDCDNKVPGTKGLGHWVETRSKKRDPRALSEGLLALIDAHTAVDAKLFAAALRLMLGRLRRVEEMTGTSLLKCVNWHKLRAATAYVPGLWTGDDALAS